MRIPGPYSDDTWEWLPRARDVAKAKPAPDNSPSRVLFELGVVLLVPLAGAGGAGLVLKSLGIS